MNREPQQPYRPFRREDGVLVHTEGDVELRIHRDQIGRLYPHRWWPDGTAVGGWRGPMAFGYTTADLVAMGDAARKL